MLGDRPAVGEDLTGARVLLLRDVAEFFEERQVDVRLDVAHRSGVAIPVPRAAEVATLLDEADVGDAAFAEAGAGEQAAEAAADDDDIGVVGERLAFDLPVEIRVVDEVGELAGDFGVLLVAVLADTLVPLAAILLAQGVGVEGQLVDRHVADGNDAFGRDPNPAALAPFGARSENSARQVRGWKTVSSVHRHAHRSSTPGQPTDQ